MGICKWYVIILISSYGLQKFESVLVPKYFELQYKCVFSHVCLHVCNCKRVIGAVFSSLGLRYGHQHQRQMSDCSVERLTYVQWVTFIARRLVLVLLLPYIYDWVKSSSSCSCIMTQGIVHSYDMI